MTSAPPPLRRLWHIQGVGYPDGGDRASRKLAETAPRGTMGSQDILVALHGHRIPVAFMVWGTPGNLAVHLGVWSSAERENAPPDVLESRMSILAASLNSLYPCVDLVGTTETELNRPPLAGIVMGIPTARPPDALEGALPLDRLSRAMQGTSWAYLILAEPVPEQVVTNLRGAVLNETRAVQTGAVAAQAPSPLTEYYSQLLGVALASLTEAQVLGLWRTAVYLIGDEVSYYRLASVWRSIFSGERSLPEPVRVIGMQQGPDLASGWCMPDAPAAPGPGSYQHPFLHQTPLTSSQLAAYVHLPSLETSGFHIRAIPHFDVVPQAVPEANSVELGKVLENTRSTEVPYRIPIEHLTKHALVAGVTGAGKTNTILWILRQLWSRRIPFLVLEPAKTEYRELLDDPQIGPDLQVFTLGEEQVSPVRLNPFEVEAGMPLATHLDLLKSVFNACFGMWNPLPQVLERGLHAVYREYGWDSVRGENHRLEDPSSRAELAEAFPTISDLHDMVSEIVDQLGYEDRIRGDIKAALSTRLNSLRIGGKGIMLDTRLSLPLADLLRVPTILELESIGDDDEKAFVMGLLLMRLYEHLRVGAEVQGGGLRHVVVVEEAHRLLANVPATANPEAANVRGKAVETFCNMLSEVRAYGQGFIVAEQIPAKLALDVLKNTNLKIVHRIVAGDDRLALSQTMHMTAEQSEMLATLRTGQAAVFSEGDDRPVLVKMPPPPTMPAAQKPEGKADGDRRVAARMADYRGQAHLTGLFVPFTACAQKCGTPHRYCEASRGLVASPEFQSLLERLPLSLALPGLPLDEGLRQLGEHLASRINAANPEQRTQAMACLCMNASRWYTVYFGRRYGWSYATVVRLRNGMAELLMHCIPAMLAPGTSPAPDGAFAKEREDYARLYRQACVRNSDPFWACSQACPKGDCLFRFHAARLLTDEALGKAFDGAQERGWGQEQPVSAERGEGKGFRDNLAWMEAVAIRLIDPAADLEVQRSAVLCFAMQHMTANPSMLSGARRVALDSLIEVFDASPSQGAEPL